MPVNITDEELDIFNKNGFTDDDVRATVENYRNQGLDDNAIRTKIDARLNSWAMPKPETIVPQEEETPVIQGGVEKNYTSNWDEKGNIYYTDENGNRIDQPKMPLGERLKGGASIWKNRINTFLNAEDRGGNTPNERTARNREKLTTTAILMATPVGRSIASGLGLNGVKLGLASGAIDGGLIGLTNGIIDKKDAKGLAGETALMSLGGAALGAGMEYASPYIQKGISYLGEKATPFIKNTFGKIGRKVPENTPTKTVQETLEKTTPNQVKQNIPTLKELKSNISKSKFPNYKLQTIKHSKQGHYYTQSLDNFENDVIRGTREFNDIIKDLYKNPEKATDLNYITEMENKIESLIPGEEYLPGAQKEAFDKFYGAIDNANSYIKLKRGDIAYFIGANKEVDATRGLPQSVVNAKGLPKEVKEIIQNDLPQYRVLHNNDLTTRAVEEIEKDFNNELSRLSTAKDFDALDYEKSRQIAKRLFDLGRHQEAVNLIDNVSINATEKGQAIQALSLWSNMTPEGAVFKAEKLITEFNKKHPKKSPIELTPKQIDDIRALQTEALNATSDTAKVQGLARTAKYISELVPANLGKKLKTYRNISLLLNPKTLGRNIVGNSLFNTVDTLSKGLAVPFDRAIGLVTKQKTRVAPQLKELFTGGAKGLKTGFKEALEGIDTRGLGQRFDLNSGRAFQSPVGQFFETALDVGLRVPDRMQYEATFAESVANMMKAQGLTEPTQKILEQAEKEALESVFQNDSVLSGSVLGLRDALNLKGAVGNKIPENYKNLLDNIGARDLGLGDLLVPYAQTPANLAQQGINYSPLGFIKGIGNALQGNQRQASLDLARATLGTGLMGGGYLLGKNKLATPSQFEDNYIKNRDVKNNLQTIGIRPDQLGDMWYAPFQPMSIPLSVGIASAYGDNPLQAGVNTLFDLPFLQNFSRGISDIKDKGIAEAGINFAGSIPAQFVPTGLSQIAQLVDPYLRETSADSKIMQGINQAITKVPFASKTLPAKYDVTGKPVERYSTNGAQRLFDIFVNPTFINKKSDDPVVNELKDLYEETKETKHFLKTADKTLTRVFDENGNPLKLSGKRYSEYQKALGEKMYEEFDYLMGSDKYKNASAEDKVEMLNDRRNVVKQLVEYEMFNVPVSKQYKNKVKKLYINMEE